jgi:cAMP-binding proteins - catabolite gene activator and regulatory subunit of cAMP-dependent protein kinases
MHLQPILMSKADEKENLVKWLKQVPIFENLEDKQLKKLQSAFTTNKFKEGEVIAKEGEMSVAFYLVSDGEVEVRKGNKTLAKLAKGQFFGEMTLLDKYPRSADVIAKTDTTCLVLPSWQFESLIMTQPKVALEIMRVLARRLREVEKNII